MLRIFVLLTLPAMAMAQVDQGRPNADFAPAFPEQTRAPALPATPVTVETFASGLDSPWGIAPIGNGQFLVTERSGQLRVINPDGSVSAPLTGVPPVADDGQGGLLDVAVSPGFAQDRTVFWTYAKPVRGGAVTAAARGTLAADGTLSGVQDIFVQDNPARNGRHFGSRIVPMPDGTVFITTGDRGAGDGGTLVQDATTTHGKVIRVNADGTVPADNPFVGQSGNDLVWSLGHRNMQGAAIGPGGLWTIEHGPRGGDELNQPKPGLNYGWPVVSYGINYRGSDVGRGQPRAPGFEEPVYYWDPVIAPGGMGFYDGPYTEWQGDLFIGSLNPGALVRLKLADGKVVGEERLLTNVGRVRDVEVLDDGRLLVLLDSGSVLRVTPG
ncbi:PQQ-dependent sugar dehydrogenase [Yoonia sediminilitoris]|uniref:Glucose/arabinose dehydrogenase n=1 Tax=Yoonia sediminilitoris TaxID=1286148 RepID=A0A2T6KLB2_9RHOB|nr:PQQ-dependent sugar dehydrogenase [Yoonia sediminilitoris]PUB17002.1 glucose/arabinose dehydrogenase [Yoonia sediminilitoris]RCW97297.1 glucose/arabinose dehydrogenase [Yoonia sediminilitoris]